MGRVTLTAVLIASCQWPAGERVVFQEGVRGCVTVDYGVAGAPALPVEEGFLLIVVDGGGQRIRTSSATRPGKFVTSEYYDAFSGRRTRVSPGVGGHSSGGADGGVLTMVSCYY
jgi:hypothetical protein